MQLRDGKILIHMYRSTTGNDILKKTLMPEQLLRYLTTLFQLHKFLHIIQAEKISKLGKKVRIGRETHPISLYYSGSWLGKLWKNMKNLNPYSQQPN
jgi:hypothetical protein